MNEFQILGSIVIVVILVLIAVCRPDTQMAQFARVFGVLFGLFTLMIIVALMHVSYRQKNKLRYTEWLRDHTTIPFYTALSNGTYDVLGSYRNLDGQWLAILYPVSIVSVDPVGTNFNVIVERKGDYPLLVNLGDVIISSPTYRKKDYPQTCFVEISQTGTNKFIQDFNPVLEK